jgi:multiple sugar transport system substrate-binding protein
MRKLGLLLALPLLWAGCGGETTAPPEEQPTENPTLTIWWAQWAPATGLQELAAAFATDYGIDVEVHQIPWSSYQDQVFLNFGNRETDFDIVIGDSQWLGRGAEQGLYLDLTDWLPTNVDLEALHPRALKYLCEYPPGSGQYYAAPCETDAVGFAYRKDWFEDPGEQLAFQTQYGRVLEPPETWEEFRDIAQFFNRPDEGRFGCALLTGRGYDSLTMGFQQVMWAFGGSWGEFGLFEPVGRLNSAESVAALAFFKELLAFAPPGAVNFDYSRTVESFNNGSTAMAMTYFAFCPGIQEQMGEQAGYFVMPAREGERFSSLGGQGLSISAKIPEDRQGRAKQFIAWFLQEEIQRKWVRKEAGFTANKNVLDSEAFHAIAPYNAALAESLDYTKDFWNVPIYNELLAASQRRLGEALDGVQEPEAALTTLAEEHQQLFIDEGYRQAE